MELFDLENTRRLKQDEGQESRIETRMKSDKGNGVLFIPEKGDVKQEPGNPGSSSKKSVSGSGLLVQRAMVTRFSLTPVGGSAETSSYCNKSFATIIKDLVM